MQVSTTEDGSVIESEESGPESDAGGDTDFEDERLCDTVFEILKNSRRRAVLRHLRAADGGVTKSELAEEIAAAENDKPVPELRSQERKRVYVSLYQFHLPKMEDAGAVDTDDRGRVRLGDDAEPFLEVLESDSETDRWYSYYLGLSLFGIAAFTASVLAESAVTLTAAAVIAALFALALLHGRSSTA